MLAAFKRPLRVKLCDLTQFYSPASGGVRRYIGEKVRFLRAHTADEHILIIPGENDECTGDERARTYTIKSPLISRTSRYRVLLRLEAIERILEKERPHLIESGDPYQVAWKAVHSGAALGIPVIGFYHSHFPEAYIRTVEKFCGRTITDFFMDSARRYIRSLYNRFERTLVPSPALGELLNSWGVQNVAHTDLGVDTTVFRPKEAGGGEHKERSRGRESERVRTDLGIPDKAKLLLYVGRLAHEKNTHTLFAAFRRLVRIDPDRYHLLIIGDGTQRGELQSLLADHRDCITHISRADTARLAPLYRAADLFVHPGVQETFGLVTLEAQACGTPVIGIRGSYMDRIIHNDQTLWARENSPAALATAIGDAAAANLKCNPAALHARVASQYSWEQVFKRLFGLYQEVMTKYRRR
jgi:alpha-1,6-mannosyltransferase